MAHDKDYVASVLAYHLNLTGPAEVVQTACSSSLVAVARGVHALRLGLCDVALCGGASFSPDEALSAVRPAAPRSRDPPRRRRQPYGPVGCSSAAARRSRA